MTRLTPRLVSILLAGDELDGFPVCAPTSHIKVFLPAEGETEPVLPQHGPDGPIWPEGQPRPVSRTYTPVRFDPETRMLEVQFLLHGEGPASQWAAKARAGDRIAVAWPGGRFELDPNTSRWWIAGDESAIPAIVTLLRELNADAVAEVHIEVSGGEDELPLTDRPGVTVHWHHRRAPDAWGQELIDAAANAAITADSAVWAACEAEAMRRIRRYFLEQDTVDRRMLTTRGYWRRGTANHPDHDHGDD